MPISTEVGLFVFKV